MHESVRERMKREDDRRGNKESKTDGGGVKKREHFVSLPEAGLLSLCFIFRGSHYSGMMLQNRYQIYWYIHTPSSLTNSKTLYNTNGHNLMHMNSFDPQEILRSCSYCSNLILSTNLGIEYELSSGPTSQEQASEHCEY